MNLFGFALIMACLAVIAFILVYLWATQEDPDPGRHAAGRPIRVQFGEHPYPPAGYAPAAFPPEDNAPAEPDPDPLERLTAIIREHLEREPEHQANRLYDTGELRQLAYAGDTAALEADARAWQEAL